MVSKQRTRNKAFDLGEADGAIRHPQISSLRGYRLVSTVPSSELIVEPIVW